MKLLVILIFSLSSRVFAKQWIDPHDMNTDSKRNMKKSSSTGHLPEYHKEHNDVLNIENNSFVYLKRFVNLLVNTASIDKSDPVKYNGQLHFSIDNEKFKFLLDFSNNKHADIEQLRKLDSILSDIFHKSYFDHVSNMIVSSQEEFFKFLFSKNSLPLVGLSLFVYISYNLFRSNFSVWYILRYFILIVILIDFAQRYQQLYEKVEEHNMHVKYSTKCDTVKMNWSEYFRFMTGHQDCESKTVSLLDVGLLQIKSLIIVPLSAVGTGMGHFASELWKNLPFPWNILIFPIMLVFCVLLAAIMMTIANDTPFKINLMHLFHLEFGANSGITGATLEKILDSMTHRFKLEKVKGKKNENSPPKHTHRPMLEEIKGKKNENSPPKKKFTPKSIEKKKEQIKHDKNNSYKKENSKDSNSVKNISFKKESDVLDKEINIPEKVSTSNDPKQLN